MCSASGAGAALARVCEAIEEIARQPSPAREDVTARVAAAWALVADADPELARRLPGYLQAAGLRLR